MFLQGVAGSDGLPGENGEPVSRTSMLTSHSWQSKTVV